MMAKLNKQRSPMVIIFVTVFIDLVGFGIVLLLSPFYAQHFGATAAQVGMLQATYSLMQFLFAPVWGRLSDRVGRRPILLMSIFGSAGSQLGYALAPSFWWLVVARGFAGVCG